MWKRFFIAVVLAISVPASIIATAVPASAAPPACTGSFIAQWSTQHSFSYTPGHWCMSTGRHGSEVVWQSDGNLVWYVNRDGHVLWASNTCKQGCANSGATWLRFQVDGNVVIYDSRGHPLWALGASNQRTSSTTFTWELARFPRSCFLVKTDFAWLHHQDNPDKTLSTKDVCH
jgi:hypothetical protein